MIFIYHHDNKVVNVKRNENEIAFQEQSVALVLFEMATIFPDELLIWCHFDLKEHINHSQLPEIFHHKKIMASFNVFENSFLSSGIGYVEGSPSVKINPKATYPTWQMSPCIGGINTSVLLLFNDKIKATSNFDYFLSSLAKLAMPEGLLCYSAPGFLKSTSKTGGKYKNNSYILFRFVKQHYRMRWVFLLLFNFFIYERKLPIMPFIFSLFYKKRTLQKKLLENVEVLSTKKVLDKRTIDVIIPTIGRKEYLYDVLKDLSVQTHLPVNVIIVEQNTNPESTSELDYLNSQDWPFIIKHTFTHQAGACNARNVALAQVESEWVFLNDDDNRFDADLISKTLENCEKFGSLVASNCYLKRNETNKTNNVYQPSFFGSGNSFVLSALLSKVSFRMGFEFGYGEDSDFGFQLRNIGADVLFFPNPQILHLSAPMGGFRTKPILAWKDDAIQPKPSPTIMLYNQLHLTKEQLCGYKTMLFFKYYKVQKIKNPFKYFLNFKKQWKQSMYWSNVLKSRK